MKTMTTVGLRYLIRGFGKTLKNRFFSLLLFTLISSLKRLVADYYVQKSQNRNQKTMNKTANAPVAEAANGAKKDDRLARFIEKVTADKESVDLYFDGKITKDELHARGIRFIKGL
jgi:hypothetical protein